MRIGYFGGSFDPPHLGHLAVATAAAHTFALDQVLFVPTSNQPLKPLGPSAPYADRLAMVELLCAESPPALHCVASTLEAPLPNNAPHYTVDTLQRLRSTLAPDDTLFVLVGADAFLQLPQWRSPERLLQLADWIVVSRPRLDGTSFGRTRLDALIATLTRTAGAPGAALSAAERVASETWDSPAARARIHLLEDVADPTSATALRTSLADRKSTSHLDGLPPTILSYIQTHHLYGL